MVDGENSGSMEADLICGHCTLTSAPNFTASISLCA